MEAATLQTMKDTEVESDGQARSAPVEDWNTASMNLQDFDREQKEGSYETPHEVDGMELGSEEGQGLEQEIDNLHKLIAYFTKIKEPEMRYLFLHGIWNMSMETMEKFGSDELDSLWHKLQKKKM